MKIIVQRYTVMSSWISLTLFTICIPCLDEKLFDYFSKKKKTVYSLEYLLTALKTGSEALTPI